MKLFPRLFRTGAAVLSERIDELAEMVHGLLDGGLDADNLGAVALGTGAFVENRSMFVVSGLAPSSGGSAYLTFKAKAACRIIGWSLHFHDTAWISAVLKVNGATIDTMPAPDGGRVLYRPLAAPVALAAGDAVAAALTALGGGVFERVDVMLDSLHVV